jgi:hypothetical protein
MANPEEGRCPPDPGSVLGHSSSREPRPSSIGEPFVRQGDRRVVEGRVGLLGPGHPAQKASAVTARMVTHRRWVLVTMVSSRRWPVASAEPTVVGGQTVDPVADRSGGSNAATVR